MRTQRGFTLFELMITVAIGALLVTLAVPSFNTMLQNNRLTSQINEFVATLQLARSEAVKRNETVILCATDDPAADPLDCTAAADWETGWIVFSDADSDGAPSATADECNAGADCIVAVHAAVEGLNTLRGEPAAVADSIAYQPSGISDDSGTFILCDPRGAGHAKAIVVSTTGRPRASKKKADGTALTCP
ncbi:MAG: prepilin-type N-terminal cleavage/methylation domain-containing protein [Gammaproteobacteria bacterium]|nr:prepilin-type N-terminal cleavage/methylation domain-containing protein [Gammaproteobacteria bacterium]NIR85840.1 prepilin-type N-terminal cleavage/methylation domain-containing protein [Gammaproteobacteria bacterium]NIR90596.1 prepilin-type N-terminal cleavage/methylation domain-containing protein [Gammaproteobacteria bacterium]NIU06975.1 prepilin-type N-terminal cleavage/methylation domain-containing protein [Gammaproteobacteria bacterium]NIV75888.1 prepilin-type N-terminal cleavage/methyl